LPYDTIDQVRSRLIAVNKSFAALGQQSAGAWGDFGKVGPVGEAPFVSPIANFYMTCPISRASRTMAECVDSRRHQMAAE
jgi:NADH-quinone oxidoreductase subunit G